VFGYLFEWENRPIFRYELVTEFAENEVQASLLKDIAFIVFLCEEPMYEREIRCLPSPLGT